MEVDLNKWKTQYMIYNLRDFFSFPFLQSEFAFFFMYFKHNTATRCEQNDKKDSSSMIQIY